MVKMDVGMSSVFETFPELRIGQKLLPGSWTLLDEVLIALELQKLRSEFGFSNFGIGTLAVELDIRDFQVS